MYFTRWFINFTVLAAAASTTLKDKSLLVVYPDRVDTCSSLKSFWSLNKLVSMLFNVEHIATGDSPTAGLRNPQLWRRINTGVTTWNARRRLGEGDDLKACRGPDRLVSETTELGAAYLTGLIQKADLINAIGELVDSNFDVIDGRKLSVSYETLRDSYVGRGLVTPSSLLLFGCQTVPFVLDPAAQGLDLNEVLKHKVALAPDFIARSDACDGCYDQLVRTILSSALFMDDDDSAQSLKEGLAARSMLLELTEKVAQYVKHVPENEWPATLGGWLKGAIGMVGSSSSSTGPSPGVPGAAEKALMVMDAIRQELASPKPGPIESAVSVYLSKMQC